MLLQLPTDVTRDDWRLLHARLAARMAARSPGACPTCAAPR